MRQAKRMRIQVQVQMNDNAARFYIEYSGSAHPTSFYRMKKKRSAAPSSPDILSPEPLFRYLTLFCIQTDISICKASKLDSLVTRSITIKCRSFSVCAAERVACHAAGSVHGAMCHGDTAGTGKSKTQTQMHEFASCFLHKDRA